MSTAREEKRLLTAEDLWEMPEVPGKVLELVDGEVVEVPGATGLHGRIVRTVLLLLHRFVSGRDLGEVFGDGVGYVLRRNPDLVRIPDVSFLSRERMPEEGITDEGYVPVPPDLAVEIISVGDRADDVREKVDEYLEAGVGVVWVVWPRRRSVSVHRRGQPTLELGPDDELEGGEVLPGFRARVSDLFEVA